MPRSTIANRRESQFDKALELRNFSAAAVSATTSETGVPFRARAYSKLRALIDVAAHTGYSAGTAQWTITVEAATSLGGSYTAVGSFIPNGTQQQYRLPLTGGQIESIVAGTTHLRVTATKTGAPGNLTYGVFLGRLD